MQESLGQTEATPPRGESAARGGNRAESGARGARRTGGGATHGRFAQTRRLPTLVEYLDVVVVVLAAAPALVLGAPVLGFVVGAVGWLLQRVLGKTDRRLIRLAREPRAQLGLNLFEAFGRIWLLAGAIVIAGVAGSRANGLTAALVIFGAYSIAFVVRVSSGPPGRPNAGASPGRPRAAAPPARPQAAAPPARPQAAGASSRPTGAPQRSASSASQTSPRSIAR
ncbi:MAG: hypothetical protein ACYCX7_09615 [Solirubrobacteraceae bacterium]